MRRLCWLLTVGLFAIRPADQLLIGTSGGVATLPS